MAEEFDEDKENEEVQEHLMGGDGGYWKSLTPIVYYNKTDAATGSFKKFMRTHIRHYLPGIYEKLLEDEPGLTKWRDMNYLMEKMADKIVYGVHYYTPKPFK